MPGETGVRAGAEPQRAVRRKRKAGPLWAGTGLAFLCLGGALAEAPSAAAPPTLPAAAANRTVLATNIPAQSLAQALQDFFHQTGIQYVALAGVIVTQQTRGTPAGVSADEALRRLFEGTGLRFEFLNERIIHIIPVDPPSSLDVPVLPFPEVLVLAHRIPKPYLAPASAREQQALDAANADLETRIAHEHLLYGRAQLDRYVQAVTERLLAIDQTDPGPVRVRVVKGIDANAFALSNGSIYLTTALLAMLDDEAQLAAVLGHELTHYTHAHALRAMREENHQEIVSRTTGGVVNAVLSLVLQHNGVYTASTPLISTQTMEIWARASISGYSRDLEREADDGGIRRMIAAGYDPAGALAALQHLSEQTAAEGAEQPPLYASHPRIEQRMASYRDLLAGELAAAAGIGERHPEEYRTQLAQLPLDQVELLILGGALDRAERLVAAEIAAADSGRAEFLKGEAYRRHVPRTDESVETAVRAYERAVSLGEAPPSAYRQVGLLHRMRGESEAAAVAFQSYLERAPTAVDAPLVRIYLDELRASSPELKR